jgi:tellurite resistance protein TehA-like permease
MRAQDDPALGPSRPAPAHDLDDPAWFGAAMGTAALATVAALNPGRLAALMGPSHAVGVALLIASATAFVALAVRDFAVRRLARTVVAQLRSPVTGAAYATIPGALNVMAVAAVQLWPSLTASTAGWWSVAALAASGTGLGLWLTVEFFVSAFEHPGVDARDISGVWFIPETVVILGALLLSVLARTGPAGVSQGLTVLAFALLGAGALLFAFTATMFINRLVLHAHDPRGAVPAVWIMISPLAVTSLAMQSVARDASLVGGTWTAAVLEMSVVLAAMLWGFALWWIAVAAVLTRHSGRAALTGTAADWAFVFPTAAMVIATLTLGRFWGSGAVEVLGAALSVALVVVWATVATSSVRVLRRGGH